MCDDAWMDHRPYSADTTTDEVLDGLDLAGTTAVVTGASGGIGLETARALAEHGARVVLANRDAAKTAAALASINEQHPGVAVEAAHLDLTDLASVRACADDLLGRFDRIDLLVNNAAVMATPLGRTHDGFELQFGTNHLGHFVLTGRLIPALIRGAPARIVNVSSGGHMASDIVWDDVNYERRPYVKWESYGQAKTANVLFAVELDRRLADRGVRAFSLHPGMIATDLGRHLRPDDYEELKERAKRSPSGGLPAYKSIPAGAATTVYAATAPELVDHGGTYLSDCAVTDQHAPWARDPDSARRLWTLSEHLVGETFDV